MKISGVRPGSRAIRKRQPRHRLAAGPVRHQRDGALHVAVLLPVRIEERRFVRDAHVLAQLRTID